MGGVVLIHDGTDWDTTKGFFIERPSGGTKPLVYSAQYLPNGNLALSGYTEGGTISFGGIPLYSHGSTDGFRGEITSEGIGISAVQMAGNGVDEHTLQATAPDGSFMVSGTYTQAISFYNADRITIGGTLGQFPSGASHDHIYFAYYNASGVFQNAEVAYNTVATTDLNNIDLVYGNGAFYAMIDCQDGGTSVMPSGEQYIYPSPIILKFDVSGIALWAKQIQATIGTVGDGEEILVNGDIVTLTGTEYGTCDLDFNSGVVSISNTSYWCEYFDGVTVAPTAAFSGTPTSVEEGQSVTYTDLSTDGTNPITSWDWTFEGGTPGTFSGQTPPAIAYATAGTYDVTLVVSDGTLSDTEVKTDYITVTVPPPFLTISPSDTTVSAASGNVVGMFAITSNEGWSIVTSDSFVIPTPSSGSGNQAINVSYPAINTMAGETYTVTVTSNSNIVEVFTINQDGVVASLTLSDYAETVDAEAGSHSILVTCPDDLSWSVPAGTFSSAVPSSGTGSMSVDINYDENTSEDQRVDVLTFSGSGVSAEFTLTQVGAGAPLEASASSDKPVYTLGQTAQLFGSATGGTGSYSYEWTGTGGFTSTEQNPTFELLSEGHYVFTLIVNDGENTVTSDVEVEVFEEGTVTLASNIQVASVEELIEFFITVNLASGDPRTIEDIIAEMGDGAEFEGDDSPFEFEHSYQAVGNYDIEITVVLSDGSVINETFLSFIDIVVGINDVDETDINIYPNPTSGQLFIDTGKSVEKLSVINISGCEVFLMENLGAKTQIDLSSLPSGLYFVRIYSDGVITTHKVVKE